MSADIMPCGCEGHADNIDLCEYPKLESEPATLRARVKELEQRATAAEKERDAAKLLLSDQCKEKMREREARAAAESALSAARELLRRVQADSHYVYLDVTLTDEVNAALTPATGEGKADTCKHGGPDPASCVDCAHPEADEQRGRVFAQAQAELATEREAHVESRMELSRALAERDEYRKTLEDLDRWLENSRFGELHPWRISIAKVLAPVKPAQPEAPKQHPGGCVCSSCVRGRFCGENGCVWPKGHPGDVHCRTVSSPPPKAPPPVASSPCAHPGAHVHPDGACPKSQPEAPSAGEEKCPNCGGVLTKLDFLNHYHCRSGSCDEFVCSKKPTPPPSPEKKCKGCGDSHATPSGCYCVEQSGAVHVCIPCEQAEPLPPSVSVPVEVLRRWCSQTTDRWLERELAKYAGGE